MFGLTPIAERLIWIAVVLLVIVGFAWHERSVGATKCELTDTKIASAQKAAQQAQQAVDAERMRNAEDAYQTELEALQHARDTDPVPRLVCKQARPKPVPAAPKVPDAPPPAPGPLPAGDSPGFDPVPGVLALADEADAAIAACRELNAEVTH